MSMNASLGERLKKNSRKAANGCIEWIGHIENTGYGAIKFQARRLKAHRAAWELKHGKVPKGLFVLHRCDNRACINPAHLFVGTQLDNIRDMIAKGRKVVRSGERHWNAKLSKEKVVEIRARYARGERQIDIARDIGMSTSAVSAAITKRNWLEDD